ncbi:MAG TPA: hypothetical protein VK864_21290 [Longimicrobiales bacterium]|nr:hypothetical protein [Longimicrobiales bacterium]
MEDAILVGLFVMGGAGLGSLWTWLVMRQPRHLTPPPPAREEPDPRQLERVLDRIDRRLESLEQRVEFSERLLSERTR